METIVHPIDYMLDNKKVRYDDFIEYACSTPLKTFLDNFKFPFLVGNDLYAGEMEDGASGQDGTVQFMGNLDQIDLSKQKFVSKSLFYLRHDERKPQVVQLFHVGRTIKSDINIVDYTISKNHAFITYENGKYFLKDLGATNGTSLNGETLEHNEPHEIHNLDKVKLGRFEFVFMHPINLFLKSRNFRKMESSLEDELTSLIRFANPRILSKVAKKYKLPHEGMGRRELVELLTDKLNATQILVELFQ